MAHKLTLDDDFLPPATIYGLISDLPDYRICYNLNLDLGLRLCRTEKDKELFHKAGKITYSDFHYHEPVQMIDWHLTSNKGGLILSAETNALENAGVPLVGDLKTINYFLWYEDHAKPELDALLLRKLKANPYIRAIQIIDNTSSRHIENLISDY